jgi:hypothetical protein
MLISEVVQTVSLMPEPDIVCLYTASLVARVGLTETLCKDLTNY